MIFGILLSVNFMKQNRDVNSVIFVLLRRLKISPAKTEEEW